MHKRSIICNRTTVNILDGGVAVGDDEDETTEDDDDQSSPKMDSELGNRNSSYWPSEKEINDKRCEFDIFKEASQGGYTVRNAVEQMILPFMPSDMDTKADLEKKVQTFLGKTKTQATLKLYQQEKIALVDSIVATKSFLEEALLEMLASNDAYYHYCTLNGLLSTWNYCGVVQVIGDGTVPINTPSPNAMRPTSTIAIRGKVRTINRWGNDLPFRTAVFVLVRRIRAGGPFQFIPWYNIAGLAPSPKVLQYYEMFTSRVRLGHAIAIGWVKIGFEDTINPEVRSIANGIVYDSNEPVPYATALESKNMVANKVVELSLRD